MILICNYSYGQQETLPRFNSNQLVGIWRNETKPRSNYLVFSRMSYIPKGFSGRIMKLSSDESMTIRSYYPIRCLSGFRANKGSIGNWYLVINENTLILINRENVVTEYKIKKLSTNFLVLQKIAVTESSTTNHDSKIKQHHRFRINSL